MAGKLAGVHSLQYKNMITVFIRLNAALNQTPQMEAKLPINAALEWTPHLIRGMQRLLEDNTNNLGTTW